MKDKPTARTTMKDMINDYQDDAVMEHAPSDLKELRVDTKDDSQMYIEYNDRLSILDETYQNIIPIGSILIRFFVIQPKRTPSGLFIPYKNMISIPTANRMAEWYSIETKYPFSKKGVVVAVPAEMTDKFSVGDIVQVSNTLKLVESSGERSKKGISAYEYLPYEFVITDLEELKNDTPESRNYGYMMIPPYEIKAILQKAK